MKWIKKYIKKQWYESRMDRCLIWSLWSWERLEGESPTLIWLTAWQGIFYHLLIRHSEDTLWSSANGIRSWTVRRMLWFLTSKGGRANHICRQAQPDEKGSPWWAAQGRCKQKSVSSHFAFIGEFTQTFLPSHPPASLVASIFLVSA